MQNSQLPTSRSLKFGNSREPAGEQPNRPSPPSIGVEVTITGNIEAALDLHIEGNVVGDVRCQTLYQGKSSKISGSIQAARVRIAGIVEGGIEARDLAVEATARVTGDVTYGRLHVANGASLEGKLKWERPAELGTDEKPIGMSSRAQPVATSVGAKSVIQAAAPFARHHHHHHHRQKGRGEPTRRQVEVIKRTET
ncbi:MAG: polymer-forming cytoskeletal protein [Pseudomonadota bacterium]|nr:polymer-forming cytoskeletal protein [Pseudomonadota bacterium]